MAQLIIDIDDTHLPRVITAFTAHLKLDQDATAADVKAFLIDQLKAVVLKQEQTGYDPGDVTVS